MWNNYAGGYPGQQQQQQPPFGSPPPPQSGGGGFSFPGAPGAPSGYPGGPPMPAMPAMPQSGYFSAPSGPPPPGQMPPPSGYPGADATRGWPNQTPSSYGGGGGGGGGGYPGNNYSGGSSYSGSSSYSGGNSYSGSSSGYGGYPAQGGGSGGGGGGGGGGNTFSWNPKLGPPPAGYVPPVPGPGSHSNAVPPPSIGGGYAGSPGGAWVNNPGGAFYTAPAAAPHMPPSTPQYGPQYGGGQQQQQYQYSQCTGRKKALCIGINYIGMEGELRGCINDAKNMKQFLIRRFNFRPEDIVMLLDDATNPRQMPTRQNIIEAMQWLVRDARPNDSLWFHYSGHGGQAKDQDGDEEDGHDETIYPYDHEYAGHLVDDDMHNIMVRSLPIGCRLTAIFDSCHSGSVLDLPYIYSTEGKIKEPNQAVEAGKGAMKAYSAYSKGDMGGVFKAGMGILKVASGGQAKATKKARELKASEADVIQWSGCKDSQTSADAFEAGKATGAMSFAFITSMDANPQQSYQQLLVSVREILRAKYSQKPQLSCSHPMDTSILFIA